MVSGDTPGSFGAGIILANGSTDSVQSVAGFVICTVLVVMTHRGDAGDSRVTLGASWTDTLCPVRNCNAFCPTTTRDISNQARGNAIVVLAGLVIGTIAI